MSYLRIGVAGAVLLLAVVESRAEALDPGELQRVPIQGLLDSRPSEWWRPCIVWAIRDPATDEAWAFTSDADLTPYIGEYVTAWLNWAVMPCGELEVVPYVSGVESTSAVDMNSWGRIKALYRTSVPN